MNAKLATKKIKKDGVEDVFKRRRVTRILKWTFAQGDHFMPDGLEPGYLWPQKEEIRKPWASRREGVWIRSLQHKARNSQGQQTQWHM